MRTADDKEGVLYTDTLHSSHTDVGVLLARGGLAMPKIVEPEDLLSAFRYRGRPVPRQYILEQVGPGWRPLVSKLMDDLLKLGWNGGVRDIKEKFGGLRFHIFYSSGAMDDIIQAAEEASLRTCEECGEPGRTDGWGSTWVKTLCERAR